MVLGAVSAVIRDYHISPITLPLLPVRPPRFIVLRGRLHSRSEWSYVRPLRGNDSSNDGDDIARLCTSCLLRIIIPLKQKSGGIKKIAN